MWKCEGEYRWNWTIFTKHTVNPKLDKMNQYENIHWFYIVEYYRVSINFCTIFSNYLVDNVAKFCDSDENQRSSIGFCQPLWLQHRVDTREDTLSWSAEVLPGDVRVGPEPKWYWNSVLQGRRDSPRTCTFFCKFSYNFVSFLTMNRDRH